MVDVTTLDDVKEILGGLVETAQIKAENAVSSFIEDGLTVDNIDEFRRVVAFTAEMIEGTASRFRRASEAGLLDDLDELDDDT